MGFAPDPFPACPTPLRCAPPLWIIQSKTPTARHRRPPLWGLLWHVEGCAPGGYRFAFKKGGPGRLVLEYLGMFLECLFDDFRMFEIVWDLFGMCFCFYLFGMLLDSFSSVGWWGDDISKSVWILGGFFGRGTFTFWWLLKLLYRANQALQSLRTGFLCRTLIPILKSGPWWSKI